MKSKICLNCFRYRPYYIQWTEHYGKLNHGVCSLHRWARKQNETCEDFEVNEKEDARREVRRFKHLGNVLRAIVEIAQILKENESEAAEGEEFEPND